MTGNTFYIECNELYKKKIETELIFFFRTLRMYSFRQVKHALDYLFMHLEHSICT